MCQDFGEEGAIMKKTFIISLLLIMGITILDYANVPAVIGLNSSNINWDFYMGFINVIVVISIFIITFKTLNKREIEINEQEIVREKNKYNVSLIFLKNCYEECTSYINLLNNNETVEKYIVPKVDFSSTDSKIVDNLQMAPFINENIIMDLVKDGQIEEDIVVEYLNIKRKYREYINFRITLFDSPQFYMQLKRELIALLDTEINKLSNQVC